MKRVHVIVEGTVQGVGYRYTLQQVAERAGATGWVRNLRKARMPRWPPSSTGCAGVPAAAR